MEDVPRGTHEMGPNVAVGKCSGMKQQGLSYWAELEDQAVKEP